MSISKRFARFAAVAAFAWAGGSASAADVVAPSYAAPAVVGSAPIIEAAPGGCASCQHGAAATTCNKCGKGFGVFNKKQNAPFPVTLCPGACFGYFQTQWRKWDDACPYPYLGQGVSDAMRAPGSGTRPGAGPGVNVGVPGPIPKGTGSELNPPRRVEPKMPQPQAPAAAPQSGIGLPAIPAPSGKFGP